MSDSDDEDDQGENDSIISSENFAASDKEEADYGHEAGDGG